MAGQARFAVGWLRTAALAAPVLALLAGCGPGATATPTATNTAPATSTPTPTAQRQPATAEGSSAAGLVPQVSLPRDEASHPSLWEWWYFNGHLEAEDGNRYAYHFVFFEVFIEALDTYVLAGHAAVTDGEDGSFEFAQRLGRRAIVPREGLEVNLGGWSMSGGAGDFRLSAATEEFGFDLEMEAVKPAALHGGDGFVEYGAAGGSYYYSYPRILTAGTVLDRGVEKQVNGISWMDHQWGDAVLDELEWDWFNLQLDDGTEVMYYQLRDLDGETLQEFGSAIDADGKVSMLGPKDVKVRALGTWESAASGGVYPQGWSVDISKNVSLTLAPVTEDAEFHIPGSMLPIYWEGEVLVTGQGEGGPISGYGFVELVGYASP